jgi:Ca2+-binding EF-hand superfamily protein
MALLSDRVREAFKTWDTEGDGTITKTGLKLWLGDSVRNIWDFQKKKHKKAGDFGFFSGTEMGTFELPRLLNRTGTGEISFGVSWWCHLKLFRQQNFSEGDRHMYSFEVY